MACSGRVGFCSDGSWRTFGVRKDFAPAAKLQREDDISASVVIPAAHLTGLHPHLKEPAGMAHHSAFVQNFFGRVFSDPASVFPGDMLRPEEQSMDDFAAGVEHIVEAQQKAALMYFEDGGIDLAIPPLKALLEIMAHGTWQGRSAGDPVFRALFNRETMLASEWYAARLEARAALDRRLWARHARDLRQFLNRRTRLQTSGREAMQSSLTAADRSRAGFSQPSRCCQSLSRHHWSGPFACSCGT